MLANPLFWKLVQGLKAKKKTLTVIESCCGGLINASVMQVPGSSEVYYGGSVAYNTRRAKKLLLNDNDLHIKLLQKYDNDDDDNDDTVTEADRYIKSKLRWTEATSKAFCEQLETDYAIAEGGASGPTFRPHGLTKGFAVIAIAGRDANTGKGKLLAQTVIHSTHSNRTENMKLFANEAATLATETIIGINDENNASIGNSTTDDEFSRHDGDDNDDKGMWLDRASHLRQDETRLKNIEENMNPTYVVLRDTKDCLFDITDTSRLILLKDVPSHLPKTFLGLEGGNPIFTVDVQSKDLDTLKMPPGAVFDNIRTHAPLLTPKDNELVLYATAMAQWHRLHKYCSSCGHPLKRIHGGSCLQCTNQHENCQSTHWWPRQDPSIIVLVTNRDGSKALLARSARHPPKMHTCIAGFVEAGETFEKAVMRETMEETGAIVDPDSITYLSSQPWPFPRSCMIGFRATADDEIPLEIDPNEIVSASWFDKDQVASAAKVPGAVMNHEVAQKALEQNHTLDLLIPPKGVLARSLIDNWLEDSHLLK